MLVRAFRLTDKLSNAFLKLNIYAVSLLLGRVAGIQQALDATIAAFGETFARRRAAAPESPTEHVQQAMVQRASDGAAIQMRDPDYSLVTGEGRVIEDPLLSRNRSLSAFAVLLLVALIVVLVWLPGADSRQGNPGVGFIRGAIPTNPASVAEAPSIPTPLPSPSPTNPVISSVTGTLVFTLRQNGQDDLWALPVGSTQALRLTDNPTDDRDPAWSPDGQRIAFSSRRDGGPWDLYILEVATGALQQLTTTFGYEGSPTWSPDGAFLVYEGYSAETESIDLYLIRTDGDSSAQCGTPCQLTYSPQPDIDPAWSPGEGRQIAYVSYRNGSRDILLLDLNNPQEGDAFNLTNSPDIEESTPRWSPDGSRLVYSANVQGVNGVYIQPANGSQAPRLIARGAFATWNPTDASSVFLVTPQGQNSALILSQVDVFGGGANAVAFQGRVSDLDWANSSSQLQGFAPDSNLLYREEVARLEDNRIPLRTLPTVQTQDTEVARLSDAVDDSFNAMRQQALDSIGYDFLGSLESTYWSLTTNDNRSLRLPEPGQARQNWHYTGRAISLNRDLVFAEQPPLLVVAREDTELGTAWRVFARVAENAQNGALGEPLRLIPWDFASRSGNDPEAFEQGGRMMDSPPAGYYVDVTQLMNDFGWERILADRSWRSNYSGVLFWQFEKQEGLSWQDAMLQIYETGQVSAFLSGATPFPPTPLPTNTPTLEAAESAESPTPPPPDSN